MVLLDFAMKMIVIFSQIVISTSLNTPTQAEFAGYCNDVGYLQEKVTLAYGEVQTKHIINGENRSRGHVFQEIATGLDVSSSAVMANEYNKIVSEKYVELPERDDLEFYVTSNGVVFNYPAYEYDGGYYYSNSFKSNYELGLEKVVETFIE